MNGILGHPDCWMMRGAHHAIRRTTRGGFQGSWTVVPVFFMTVRTICSYGLPGEWGVDKSIVPNVGLSDEVLVKSLFREQTMRLLETTAADLGGVLGKAARPRTMAVYVDFARLLDAAAPWIELAAIKIMEEQWDVDPDNVSEETQKQLDEVLAQVRTALGVFKAVHKVTAETYLEGGATVGHSLAAIRDVK